MRLSDMMIERFTISLARRTESRQRRRRVREVYHEEYFKIVHFIPEFFRIGFVRWWDRIYRETQATNKRRTDHGQYRDPGWGERGAGAGNLSVRTALRLAWGTWAILLVLPFLLFLGVVWMLMFHEATGVRVEQHSWFLASSAYLLVVVPASFSGEEDFSKHIGRGTRFRRRNIFMECWRSGRRWNLVESSRCWDVSSSDPFCRICCRLSSHLCFS